MQENERWFGVREAWIQILACAHSLGGAGNFLSLSEPCFPHRGTNKVLPAERGLPGAEDAQ